MKNLLIIIITLFSFTASAQTVEEVNMVVLVNQVRTNPKSFIPVIEDYITELEDKDNKFNIKGVVVTKKTNNISKLNEELINEAKVLIVFLNKQKSVKPLKLSLVLYTISKTHAIYLDSINKLTHVGPNNTSFKTRTKEINSYLIGENCANGDMIHAMIDLLLDFKVVDKGHRANIFNEEYKQISVANIGNVWVQDFSN